MKTRLEIQDHGIMLTDYFSGTNGVMLPISIDNKTTIKQVIESIDSEINMVWDHIEHIAAYHEFSGELESEIIEEIEKIKTENAEKMDNILDPTLDFCFNDDCELELPVLILTIEFLEY